MEVVMHASRAVALCLLAASSAFAQLTVSTIRGSVADPTGAAVAKASITITNLGTSISREPLTTESGDFEIPELQRGSYRLTAASAGFKKFVADNIILESNQIRRIDVTFELGT